MTTSNRKVGSHTLRGNPEADWSHAATYLAELYSNSLYDVDGPAPQGAAELDQDFRRRLLKAGGVDQLSEKDRDLATSLTAAAGDDISYWPGGDNYRVSAVSPTNPLGLAGDLWAAVTPADEGALVVHLIAAAGDGDLDFMAPGGRGWEPLHDLGVIEDYTFVGVNPEAVELYHNYDRDNTLGVISSYPISATGPFPTMAQQEVRMPHEIPTPRGENDEFWANSGETYGQPKEPSDEPTDEPMMASAVVIESADDLTAAIEAAERDPDLRWYVERRVAALGLEASLPWQKD
jgi:hypothetical protein